MARPKSKAERRKYLGEAILAERSDVVHAIRRKSMMTAGNAMDAKILPCKIGLAVPIAIRRLAPTLPA